MLKKLFFLFSFFFFIESTFAEEEITLERLELLRTRGAISQEDYIFLKEELEGTLEEKIQNTTYL
ncbi:MAG: hypothetical protein ACRC34_04180 [Cetobacterium sp.]